MNGYGVGTPPEVRLVRDVRGCRACGWFWGGVPPYGPYPSYDWLEDFPAEVVAMGSQSASNVKPFSLLKARATGARFVEPGVMHGCRKAPIMTLGINPNLTAWFPYSSGARWIYPTLSSDARYAYYYRHFTLYQEGLTLEAMLAFVESDSRILAEDDGWVISATRGSSHHYKQLEVQYQGRTGTTIYDLAYTPERRIAIFHDHGDSRKPNTWFKKGELLAGVLQAPDSVDVQIQSNAAGYYQRMIPILERFKKQVSLEADLRIGEDVAQHDMVACASPGWQERYDMPTDRIAAHCVAEAAYAVTQVLQTQPAVIILVGGSALSMFRSVFGSFMDLKHAGRNIYQLLDETVFRPTWLTIDVEGLVFRSRLITVPHFSYEANFLRQARLSESAWKAFSEDFASDARLLAQEKRVWAAGSDGTVPIEIQGDTDPIRSLLSIAAWQVLSAYTMDPFEMAATALAQEYQSGRLSFDPKAKRLRRGDGGCRYCVNDQWRFPQGCLYGKPDEVSPAPEQIDRARNTILARARQVRAEQAKQESSP
jgi:hypothetical protein